MPWATTRQTIGTEAKYRSAEHRRRRAELVTLIKAGHALDCTAKVCEFGYPITNPDGRAPDGLHLGHEDNGVDYAGPQHNRCNVKDGARRGNARSRGVVEGPRRWAL
jgi:hypothetical protein